MSRLAVVSRAVAASSSSMTQRTFHTSRPAQEHFLKVGTEAFAKRALDAESKKPILVDFYADWCQPCRVLSPVLERLTSPESGVDLMTINVDDHPELAGQYGVTALPTVVAFKEGQKANKFVGVLKEQQIRDFISKL